MKKKGFTLAELLGVIVILGIIAMIAIPTVNKLVKESKEKAYRSQIAILIDAAKKWGGANTDKTDLLTEGTYFYLSPSALEKEGYLDKKDILDPRTGKSITGCVQLGYSNAYKQVTYDYLESCNTDGKPIISFSSGDTMRVLQGTPIVLPVVKAISASGIPLNISQLPTKVTKNGTITTLSQVNSNTLGDQFLLTYSVTDPLNSKVGTKDLKIIIVPPKPTIGLVGAEYMTVDIGTPFVDPGVSAFTATGQPITDITKTITKGGTTVSSVDSKVFATYQITYKVNYYDYTQEFKRTVEIVDYMKPVITVNGKTTNHSMDAYTDTGFTAPTATYTDNSVFSGSTYTLTTNVTSTVNPSVAGTYTITYTATDYKGNKTTLVLTVVMKVKYYAITMSQTTGGTVTPSKTQAAKNETVNLTTAATSGYLYAGATIKSPAGTTLITLNGSQTSFTMPTSDVIITPSWQSAPVITQQPADVSVGYTTAASGSASFTVAVNTTGLTYQWYKTLSNTATGGTEIAGATSATYTIPQSQVQPSIHKTYYYCKITTSYGGVLYSRAAVLMVPYTFMSGCLSASGGWYSGGEKSSGNYDLNTYFNSYRYTTLHATGSGGGSDSCSGANGCGVTCNGRANGTQRITVGGSNFTVNGNINTNIASYSNKVVSFYVYAYAEGTCHSGCTCYDFTWGASICNAYID